MTRFGLQRAQTTLRETRHGRIRIRLHDLVQRGLGLIPFFKFVLTVTDLEQRVGRLLVIRIALEQGAERLLGDLVVLGDVVRLAEPVVRIAGQLAVRILIDEALETPRRFCVTAILERRERRIISSGFRRCIARCRRRVRVCGVVLRLATTSSGVIPSVQAAAKASAMLPP